MSLKFSKPENDAVYLYMLKKEREGKACKVAKIAALNKFLRIYYARVKEVSSNFNETQNPIKPTCNIWLNLCVR